jgi:hypothetical protein
MEKEEPTLASRFNELMSLQYHQVSPNEQFPDASKRAAEIGFPFERSNLKHQDSKLGHELPN